MEIDGNTAKETYSLVENNAGWQMKAKWIGLCVCVLTMCSCSTDTVSVGTVKLYKEDSLPENKTALVEGIWGFFGKGVATAICKVDKKSFDPCVIAVELLPGEHSVDVRLILASAEIHRTYVQKFSAGREYQVRPKKKGDGTEEPVIEFKRSRVPN
jgi:hypothetical protein